MRNHPNGSIRVESVEYMPEALDPGTLYVSNRFRTALHLCACGCGEETVTPLGPSGWTLTDGPTLRPSIGQRLPCRAHYFITDGRIVWV